MVQKQSNVGGERSFTCLGFNTIQFRMSHFALCLTCNFRILFFKNEKIELEGFIHY